MGQVCPGWPGGLCLQTGLQKRAGRFPQQWCNWSVWSGCFPPQGCQHPQMRGDKLLQVLAEVSPGWRPRWVPVEGFCGGFFFFSPLAAVAHSTPTSCSSIANWALTSSSRYPKRQCRRWRPARHPVPSPARVTSRDCSVLLGQGLATGCPWGWGTDELHVLLGQRYFIRWQSTSGARDDGRERLSCLSRLSPAAFPSASLGAAFLLSPPAATLGSPGLWGRSPISIPAKTLWLT